jgi:hypothetical protein
MRSTYCSRYDLGEFPIACEACTRHYSQVSEVAFRIPGRNVACHVQTFEHTMAYQAVTGALKAMIPTGR